MYLLPCNFIFGLLARLHLFNDCYYLMTATATTTRITLRVIISKSVFGAVIPKFIGSTMVKILLY